MYWTDITRKTISRSFLNGSSFEDLFHRNVRTPDGLAVDPVGRNLFWTDTGTNKLEVSKLDGSYRKALITSGLDEPRDIILDVNEGSVLFYDSESKGLYQSDRAQLVNVSFLPICPPAQMCTVNTLFGAIIYHSCSCYCNRYFTNWDK